MLSGISFFLILHRIFLVLENQTENQTINLSIMKKTTLLVAMLFLLVWGGHAQCIRTSMFPFTQVVSNNLGLPQVLSGSAYTTQYSQIANLLVGNDYTFSCQVTSSGLQKYVTVTDLSNIVIANGPSPLTVEGISASQVRLHYSDNDECESTVSQGHTITILAVVDCLPPSIFTVSDITTTNATFIWEPAADETAWQVLVTLNGTAAPTADTSGTDVTDNPTYIHTTLTSANKYQFYVRANCGTSFSPWNGPLNFSSECDPVNEFYENFDATITGQLPICWTQIKSGAAPSPYSYARVTDYNFNSPSRTAQLYNENSGTDSNIILVTPKVANLASGTHRLKFSARSGTGTQSIQLGTMDNTTLDGEFTEIETISVNATHQEYAIDYTGYEGTDTFIAIRHNGTQYSSVFIDDIKWEVAPICADVSQIQVPAESITAASATVNWNPNGAETAWDVVYGLTSVTDPNTLTPINPAPSAIPQAALTGLTDNTSYKVWVRSVCSANDGVWIGPVTFRTPCLPFTSIDENFDTIASGALPSCWSAVKSGTAISQNAYIKVLDYNFYSASRSLALYNSTSGTSSNIMLASPKLENASAGTHRVKFFARSGVATGSVQVGTVDNTTGNAVFTVVETVDITSAYTEYVVNFASYNGTDTYLAFRHNTGTANTVVYLDNIRWEATPLCADVANIAVDDITTETANVSWEPQGTETNWQVAYGEASTTDPTTLTPSEVLAVTNFPISDLTPDMAYKVWVRSVCNGTENYGTWIGPISFTTQCLPSTVPFTQDFETAVIPAMPGCTTLQNLSTANNFITSSPANYGFNSKVLQYKFNCTTTEAADAWYFTKGIMLTAGTEYTISYKYGGNSTVNIVEKLKVMYGTGAEADKMEEELADHIFTTNMAVTNVVTFTAETTGVYYFGFNVYSDACQNSVFIDDIAIQASLKTGDFNPAAFTYYPNPVKDVLNLSYTQTIGNITVYNLLGQKVIEKNINSNAAALDMAALPSGSYIVKAASENQIKTIKVIKE